MTSTSASRHRLRRWLYRHGRPNGLARLMIRPDAVLFSAGLLPHRAATLQVPGRRTGRLGSVPVVVTRAPIQRRYLAVAPGARAHLPINRRAPLQEFDRIAGQYPVFLATTVDHDDPTTP